MEITVPTFGNNAEILQQTLSSVGFSHSITCSQQFPNSNV